jgi:hypothetical protein
MGTLQEFVTSKKVGQQVTSMTRLEALSIIQDVHKLINSDGGVLDLEDAWVSGDKRKMLRARQTFCLFNMLTRMTESELDKFATGIKMKRVSRLIFRIGAPAEDGATRIECRFIRKRMS